MTCKLLIFNIYIQNKIANFNFLPKLKIRIGTESWTGRRPSSLSVFFLHLPLLFCCKIFRPHSHVSAPFLALPIQSCHFSEKSSLIASDAVMPVNVRLSRLQSLPVQNLTKYPSVTFRFKNPVSLIKVLCKILGSFFRLRCPALHAPFFSP